MPAALQDSPARIAAEVLIAKGLGVVPVLGSNTSWQVFSGSEPPGPDDCITVYETIGKGAGRSMIDGENFGFYGIQVRVRSKTPRSGYVKAAAIVKAMAENVYDEVVNLVPEGAASAVTYLLHAFDNISDPIPLGKESPTSTRRLFTINALTSIKTLT